MVLLLKIFHRFHYFQDIDSLYPTVIDYSSSTYIVTVCSEYIIVTLCSKLVNNLVQVAIDIYTGQANIVV